MLGITIIVFVIALVGVGVFGIVRGIRMKPLSDAQRRASSYSNPIDPKNVWKILGPCLLVLGLLVLLFSGIRSVPVKSVGVVTSFGHVEGDLTPGFHWELPYKTANILPETIQTTTWTGSFNRDGVCQALTVRIGGQQTACLDATIQWQVEDQAAPQLFNNYDTSGTNVLNQITTAVVVREFEQVTNQVLGDYNPIQDVALNAGAGNSLFSTFGPLVQNTMRRDIGSQIRVIRVIMPILHYDSSTQGRLNTIQATYANAAIAKEQIAVNDAQAQANAAIQNNVSANVLVQECLTLVESAAKENYQLPAGFSCFGSGSFALAIK